MTAYYNEIDKFAAAWLRELIKAGHIAPGDVDERSIVDIKPTELIGYTQCHFFAGIGVWSYALRRAGWVDDRPVWTGSCPCQPFSAAGKGGGFDDERHLWPAWFHLIEVCRPANIFGEQVASKDGLAWLDLVHTDMEAADYAFGATDLCAAGVGAPHIRQRLFFVANAGCDSAELERPGRADAAGCNEGEARKRKRVRTEHPASGGSLQLVDVQQQRLQGHGRDGDNISEPGREHADAVGSITAPSATRRMADTEHNGGRADESQRQPQGGVVDGGNTTGVCGDGAPRETNGHWRSSDWLSCRDAKWRPVEPGTFPLAHGAPARVGRLRGYGNAINAEVATEFIEACMMRG